MSVSRQAGFVQAEPELLDQMIRASAAQSGDQVTIVGRGTMALLLGLCRRGYARVSCHAAAGGPRLAEPAVDLLWLLDIAGDEQLLDAISRFGRSLRPDGRLLIHDLRSMPRGSVRRLRALLGQHGFDLERQTSADAAGGVLLSARRRLGAAGQQVQHAA
jgi:hypothetical protein